MAMSSPLCTFRMIWLLFKPGTTIYVQTGGNVKARVVEKIYVDPRVLHGESKTILPMVLTLWHLEYDGRYVGRRSTKVLIPPFDGERLVTSLPAFPCDFLDRADGNKTRQTLESLGKRWFELLQGGMIHYIGEFVGHKGSSVS